MRLSEEARRRGIEKACEAASDLAQARLTQFFGRAYKYKNLVCAARALGYSRQLIYQHAAVYPWVAHELQMLLDHYAVKITIKRQEKKGEDPDAEENP